jgi:hypothetical protein
MAIHRQNTLNCRRPFTGRTLWTADGHSQAEHSELQMAIHRQNTLKCRWPFTGRTRGRNAAVIRYLPLLKPLHILNNVELLPAFWEVDGAIWQQVTVSNVNKCKVLQHQASETNMFFLLLFCLQGFSPLTSSTYKYSRVSMSVIKWNR